MPCHLLQAPQAWDSQDQPARPWERSARSHALISPDPEESCAPFSPCCSSPCPSPRRRSPPRPSCRRSFRPSRSSVSRFTCACSWAVVGFFAAVTGRAMSNRARMARMIPPGREKSARGSWLIAPMGGLVSLENPTLEKLGEDGKAFIGFKGRDGEDAVSYTHLTLPTKRIV